MFIFNSNIVRILWSFPLMPNCHLWIDKYDYDIWLPSVQLIITYNLQDEEELKNKAAIYSYITHLVTFMSRMSRMSRGRRSSNAASYNIPRVVYQKFTGLFIDPESHALTAEKRELLIGYILVLTLFVDDFRSEPADISKDLKIPYAELKPYYKQLGCKMLHDTDLKKLVQSLPAPLKFPEQRPYRRKRE